MQELNECHYSLDIIIKIICSYEAIFKLSDHINRHICVWWDVTNLCITVEATFCQAGVCVWGAISYFHVFGHCFFQGMVTGEYYLQMLKEYVVPGL
jgi:hypothetical protein